MTILQRVNTSLNNSKASNTTVESKSAVYSDTTKINSMYFTYCDGDIPANTWTTLNWNYTDGVYVIWAFARCAQEGFGSVSTISLKNIKTTSVDVYQCNSSNARMSVKCYAIMANY